MTTVMSETDLVDVALNSDAYWSETLREMVKLNSQFIRSGHSPNDAMVLSVIHAAGGLQMYMPRPATLMHRPALIASRTRQACPKPDRTRDVSFQMGFCFPKEEIE